MTPVLVLLPPSETKSDGGSGPPLDLAGLSFPALLPVRRRLVRVLQQQARRDPAGLRRALGLTERQAAELDRDARLTTSPTSAAIARYTGVLYDHLDYPTLPPPARRRADRSLVVASALFGLLRPRDAIPAYRLSAGAVLPGLPPLAGLWRPALERELAGARGLVVDLRSGAYAALAPAPGALQVRVLREADGRRSVVSHDNKHTKGRLARRLCETGARTAADVAEVGRSVADAVEVAPGRVDLLLHGLASARQGA